MTDLTVDHPAGRLAMKDRVALVTGAGSAEGIGFASARALAAAGARIVLSATTERIFERLGELAGDHVAFLADLREPAEAEELIGNALRHFGRIDILVNNAGMTQTGVSIENSRVEAISDDEWRRHLDLNLTSAFLMTRAVLPTMRRAGFGRIVNVASVTGPLVAIPATGGYAAAKAGMTGLTRTVALENARAGITCNAVLPGWIATASSSPAELAAGVASPAGRAGTADEVAAAIAFLASPGASYVNGAMLVVDGANAIAEYRGAPDGWS